MSTPQKVLAHARKLFESADSDEAHGTVVNRAYLAAYSASKQFHDSLPLCGRCATKDHGVHEELIKRLEHPDPKLDSSLAAYSRYIADQMRMLKPLRAIADYETDQSITASDSEEALRLADDILDEAALGMKQIAKLKAQAQAPSNPTSN